MRVLPDLHQRLGARASRRRPRAGSRAMTLIEVLIVMALIALMLGTMVVGSGQLVSSRLRHSSTMISGAIRVGFARASASSKTVRLEIGRASCRERVLRLV